MLYNLRLLVYFHSTNWKIITISLYLVITFETGIFRLEEKF